jgi:hypothetical protein
MWDALRSGMRPEQERISANLLKFQVGLLYERLGEIQQLPYGLSTYSSRSIKPDPLPGKNGTYELANLGCR